MPPFTTVNHPTNSTLFTSPLSWAPRRLRVRGDPSIAAYISPRNDGEHQSRRARRAADSSTGNAITARTTAATHWPRATISAAVKTRTIRSVSANGPEGLSRERARSGGLPPHSRKRLRDRLRVLAMERVMARREVPVAVIN
jgi:hypothetical protein